jgi:hypothetical protein
MKARLISPFGLVIVWMVATGFLAPDCSWAQQVGYDDDNELDFIWTAPEGSFDHYNIYTSVDDLEYQLDGSSSTEAYTVAGQNGHRYKVKVCAVTSEDIEGPFSPESDPVICDTLAPSSPVISEQYDVLDEDTVVLTLQSPPTDINFSNYQVLGGQYTAWTDVSETSTFTFTVDPDSQNVLQIREKDLAGNVGPAASRTVENLSGDNDSDGMPNYWELLYSDILDPDDAGDAGLDSDGDGWTNYEEFAAGTDPTRDDSAPQDTTPPVIALSGDNPMTLEAGTPYAEPGYTATDDRDGDIRANVVVIGSVDHTVVGTYILRYNVSDSSGNPAEEKTRTVNVVDTTPPSVRCLTGDTSGNRGQSVTINATLDDNVSVTEAFLYYKAASAPSWSSANFLTGSAPIELPQESTEEIVYYITADDAAGNGPVGDPSADGSACYTITVLDGTQTLNLDEGWNLVGISHQPLDPSCATIFGDVAVGSIWGWDGTKSVPATSVEPLRAYWVLTTAPATVQYDYVPVSDPTPDLSAPWNAFAVANETPVPLPYPNVVGSVWGWDGTKYVRVETSLQPHKGYWVAAETTQKSAPTGPEPNAGPVILDVSLEMELSGVDKGALEIGLLDGEGWETLEPMPPASPDGFTCYILGGGASPFKCVSKKVSVFVGAADRFSWFILAQVPMRREFTLSWDSSTLPQNLILTIAELNVGDGTLKGGSLSMTETDRVSCSTTLSTTFAWRIEATCRARPSQDADGDLIADDWEKQNFIAGGCDPHADVDGDGMSNLQEFIAGTDPNDGRSVLRVSEIHADGAGQGTVLSWKSVLGRKYQVFYCNSLEDNDWRCLGEEIVGTGDTILIRDTVSRPNLWKRFYCVRGW